MFCNPNYCKPHFHSIHYFITNHKYFNIFESYYYCTAHSGMGGTANTPTPANNAVQYITTNQGQDNITESQYANFDDVLFSASGFVFSINSNGNLISTI